MIFYSSGVCVCGCNNNNNIFILWSAFVFSGYDVFLVLFSINFGLICLQSDIQKGPNTESALLNVLFLSF